MDATRTNARLPIRPSNCDGLYAEPEHDSDKQRPPLARLNIENLPV